MEEKIKNLIKDALKNLGIEHEGFAVEHPDDFSNGDYSTNVALVSAKKIGTSPKELAEKIKTELEKNLPKEILKIDVAGPGFINFHLSREFFRGTVEAIVNQGDGYGKNHLFAGKKIMAEYTDPNPFKPFHIGHLMTNAIGESIARILEHSGAQVARANYQGDIGLHVAKAIWGLQGDETLRRKLDSRSEEARHIGRAYVAGAEAYESEPQAKIEIDEINKKLYAKTDPAINELYQWGFEATMEAFEDIYRLLGTQFDYYFLESQMAPIGEDIVREHTDTVFEKSDGAIVFRAEKYDPKLHTRVFITSQGLPTYETKELGLTREKFKTYPGMDMSIVITANEQTEYMKVVARAIGLIHPEYQSRMRHITHGMMRLSSGKMSSRKGNIVTGESLLRDTIALVTERMADRDWQEGDKHAAAEAVGVAAIKYSILRSKTGGDIVFDPEESISLEGDSGPYLQYSYARANSVLEKAKKENILPDPHAAPETAVDVEKLLYRFPEVVSKAALAYEPHFIATYLVELARAYNSFYGNNTIVAKDDAYSPYKVALTFAFVFVIKNGLHLLGIKAPDRM